MVLYSFDLLSVARPALSSGQQSSRRPGYRLPSFVRSSFWHTFGSMRKNSGARSTGKRTHTHQTWKRERKRGEERASAAAPKRTPHAHTPTHTYTQAHRVQAARAATHATSHSVRAVGVACVWLVRRIRTAQNRKVATFLRVGPGSAAQVGAVGWEVGGLLGHPPLKYIDHHLFRQ
jgi:hypothetical protein